MELCYSRRFEDAERLLKHVTRLQHEDRAANVVLQRRRQYSPSPPPPDCNGNGIVSLDEK